MHQHDEHRYENGQPEENPDRTRIALHGWLIMLGDVIHVFVASRSTRRQLWRKYHGFDSAT